MDWRSWSVGFLVTVVLGGPVYGTCPATPTNSGVTYLEKGTKEMVAHCSAATEVLTGNKRAVLAFCRTDNKWDPDISTQTCGSDTSNIISTGPCPTATDPADSTAEEVLATNKVIARYYKCNAGKAWLSGRDGRLSECVSNDWTPITDKCETDCGVPRDCEDVFKLGHYVTGSYKVIPSGIKYDEPVTVWCDMLEDDEGVWTNVLKKVTATQPNDPMAVVGAGKQDPSTAADFFIGMKNLVALNYGTGGVSPRPLVFQFLVEVGGVWRHVTYDSVNIAPEAEFYKLSTLGNFHGDAGDYLSAAVETNYDTSSMWWIPADTSLPKITPLNSLTWGDQTATKIRLRVRTKGYDEELSCPSLDVMSLNWTSPSTPLNYEAYVPLSRAVGAQVTYKCLGDDMYKEGATGGTRSREGARVCEAVSGGNPKWSDPLVLPCSFTCPADFHLSTDKISCYHFSASSVQGSVIEAARECYKLGATLALVDDPDTVPWDKADAAEYYLTLHLIDFPRVVYSVMQNFTHLPPSTYTCGGDCNAIEGTTRCVVAKKDSYKAQDCKTSSNRYMCRLPGKCRNNNFFFQEMKGRCYKTGIVYDNDIGACEAACEREGGTLAYPETLEELQSIVSHLKTSGSNVAALNGMHFIIGLNNAWGDWTANGVFSPSAKVIELAEETGLSSDQHWLAIDPTQQTDDSHPVFKKDIFVGSKAVLCQQPGIPGCWSSPPEPSTNMVQVWDSDSNTGSTVIYMCFPGYFVNGNISVANQTKTCYSIVGGWQPGQVEGCQVVEVCTGDIPAPTSALVTNSTLASNLLHLNSSINFTCPDGMATSTLAVVQSVTCIEASEGVYSFSPTAVEECSVCVKVPTVVNATTAHALGTTYSVNDTVLATCNNNHMFSVGQATKDVKCTDAGWEEVDACYEGCPSAPPTNGSNTGRDPQTTNAVGTVLNYTCDAGYYLPSLQGVDYTTWRSVTCNTSHQWDPPDPITCVKVCLGTPPAPPANGNTTWISDRSEGTQYELKCTTNHTFTNSSISLTITCEATGKWTSVDQELFICRIPCATTLLATPAGSTKEGTDAPHWLGDEVTFTCPPGQESRDGETKLELNCGDQGWNIDSTTFACFNACTVDPYSVAAPVNSSWNGKTRVVDTEVTYSCPTNLLLGDLASSLTITCHDNKTWTPMDTDILQCREACASTIMATPTGSVMEGPEAPHWVGDHVDFTCGPEQESEDRDTRLNLHCGDQGWNVTTTSFACFNACQVDPYPVTSPVVSSWNGKTRIIDTTVTYSCPTGLVLGDLSSSLTITCHDNKTWTELDPKILQCRKECSTSPPAAPANTTASSGPPYWESETLTYSCPPGYAATTGGTDVDLTCTNNTWTAIPLGFTCILGCPNSAPIPPGDAKSNDTGIQTRGMVVKYTCGSGFNNGRLTSISTCTDENKWEPFILPGCDDPNIDDPEEIVFITYPSANILTQNYKKSTDYHQPNIEDGLTDANSKPENYELSTGPFGFEYAIKLASKEEQCLVKNDTAPDTPLSCMHNPGNCTTGFSVSIWEKKLFTWDQFKNHEAYPGCYENQYILSTGGDDKGHPGIALYHEGIMLVAIVSTGPTYWKQHMAGAVANETWFNIGLRWNLRDGMEVKVNNMTYSVTKESKTATAKPALNPPEVIFGCHRDSTDKNYRGYTDGEYDEFAYWGRMLSDEESIFFLGGYDGNPKNLGMEEYKAMLQKSDLNSPDQNTMALDVIGQMLSPPKTSSQIQPVPDTKATDAQLQAEAAKDAANFKEAVKIIKKLTDPKTVVPCMTAEQVDRAKLAASNLINNLLTDDKKVKWKAYEEEMDDGAAMPVLSQVVKYMAGIGTAAGCIKNYERKYSITDKHVHMEVSKWTVKELMNKGFSFRAPDYLTREMLNRKFGNKREWASVPTDLYIDPRCQSRGVSLAFGIFENVETVLPTPLKMNPSQFSDNVKYELHARVMAMSLQADPALLEDGQVNPRAPRCIPDPDKLKTHCKYWHLKEFAHPAKYQLLFHDDEEEVKIDTRHCVWWNDEIKAWDKTGCKVWSSTASSSECECKRTGLFTVIAQQLDPKVVPDDPSWLTIIRYILYSVSGLCLLIFILVVAFAGDLKEQFHLMGLCLAVSLLAGSVMMVVSDFRSVRTDRHACTAIGTLLHLSYLFAAGWIAMIGHAAFKCITSGIVGGGLKQYAHLSGGLTLLSVGITYTFYLHDLGTDPRCFISWFAMPKRVFFLPCAVFIFVGLFCACVIFFNLRTTALRNNPTLTDYRSFSLGSAFLTLYFTLTWTLGILTYSELGKTVDLYPYFQILNSLLGVVLLICIGIGSSRFRMVLAGQAKKRREKFLSYTRGNQNKKLYESPTHIAQTPPTRPVSATPPSLESTRPLTTASDFPSRLPTPNNPSSALRFNDNY